MTFSMPYSRKPFNGTSEKRKSLHWLLFFFSRFTFNKMLRLQINAWHNYDFSVPWKGYTDWKGMRHWSTVQLLWHYSYRVHCCITRALSSFLCCTGTLCFHFAWVTAALNLVLLLFSCITYSTSRSGQRLISLILSPLILWIWIHIEEYMLFRW